MIVVIVRDRDGNFIKRLTLFDEEPPPQVIINGVVYIHKASLMPTGEAIYQPPYLPTKRKP